MWSAKTNVEAVGQPAAHHTCYTSRQNGAERHKDAQTVLTTVGKGDKLYVEGQLRTRNYVDKQGRTCYVTEIWADNIEILTPRPAASNNGAPAPQNGQV